MPTNSQIVEIKALITTIALEIVISGKKSAKSDDAIKAELADLQDYLQNYKKLSFDDFSRLCHTDDGFLFLNILNMNKYYIKFDNFGKIIGKKRVVIFSPASNEIIIKNCNSSGYVRRSEEPRYDMREMDATHKWRAEQAEIYGTSENRERSAAYWRQQNTPPSY